MADRSYKREGIRIKSSVVLFGDYECPSFNFNRLYSDSFNVMIKKGEENVNLLLSFKHINRIEFLDNSERNGAGFVMFINDFMAKKIQETLDAGGTGFSEYVSPYDSKNRFFVLDVINCYPESIKAIYEMLRKSEDFHRRYIIEQCNKTGVDCSSSLPSQYINVIGFNQWKALLGTMGKDIYHEQVEAETNNKIQKYTIGTICNAKAWESYTMRHDGSLIQRSRRTTDENSFGINRQPLVASNKVQGAMEHSFSTPNSIKPGAPISNSTPKANGNANNSSFSQRLNVATPSSLSARNPSTWKMSSSTPRAAQRQKREVQVIEFDDQQFDDEPETSGESSIKRANDTVFVYPRDVKGASTCPVHYSDLKHLDPDFMLNDTIIDFRLKYILHDLVDEERRTGIFMFNSFFYSRLSQLPLHGKINVTAATRAKRVSANFQNIRSWTKKVNLFEKEFIVVPINEDIHWYLAIIVNAKAGIVGSSEYKAKKKPFLVILDSLIDPSEPKHSIVQQHLAEYLSLEYNNKKEEHSLPGTGFDKSSLIVVNPKGTPQQKNYIDCGVFLLQFAELFLTRPPKKLTKRASFMAWFPDFQIKDKRNDIRACIKRLAPHVRYTDFLPEPVVVKSKRGRKQTQVEVQPIPTRTRRHSSSSITRMEKETQFTSSLLHNRSFDSIIEATKDGPPMVITAQDILRQRNMEI